MLQQQEQALSTRCNRCTAQIQNWILFACKHTYHDLYWIYAFLVQGQHRLVSWFRMLVIEKEPNLSQIRKVSNFARPSKMAERNRTLRVIVHHRSNFRSWLPDRAEEWTNLGNSCVRDLLHGPVVQVTGGLQILKRYLFHSKRIHLSGYLTFRAGFKLGPFPSQAANWCAILETSSMIKPNAVCSSSHYFVVQLRQVSHILQREGVIGRVSNLCT